MEAVAERVDTWKAANSLLRANIWSEKDPVLISDVLTLAIFLEGNMAVQVEAKKVELEAELSRYSIDAQLAANGISMEEGDEEEEEEEPDGEEVG